MKKILIFVIIIIFAILGVIILKPNNKIENDENNEYIKTDNIQNLNEEQSNLKIRLKINNKELTATLIDNSSSRGLLEKLEAGPVTINAHDYSNFEKVGELGFSLPRNDENYTTKPGDIILYQGNMLTIYYDTNTWDFTKLGRIDDISQDELKELLGEGDVVIVVEKY